MKFLNSDQASDYVAKEILEVLHCITIKKNNLEVFERPASNKFFTLSMMLMETPISGCYLNIKKDDLKNLVVENIKNQKSDFKSIKVSCKIFIDKLIAKSKNWRVIGPLRGIEIEDGEITVGSVHFLPASPENIRTHIINRHNGIELSNIPYLLDKNIKRVEDFEEKWKYYFNHGSIVYVYVKGNKESVTYPAYEKINQALNVFRVYSILLNEINITFKIFQDKHYENRDYFLIDEDNSTFTTKYDLIGNPQPLHITSSLISQIFDNGFERLCEIQGKSEEDSSQLENLIRDATSWLSLTTETNRTAEILLLSIIAFETLLGIKERDKQIPHKTSLLIAINLPEKRQIKKDIDRFYTLRDEIVHEGRRKLFPGDSVKIQRYAARLISRCCIAPKIKKLHTKEELLIFCKSLNDNFRKG